MQNECGDGEVGLYGKLPYTIKLWSCNQDIGACYWLATLRDVERSTCWAEFNHLTPAFATATGASM